MKPRAARSATDARILRAAVRLFARHGFQATGIRELAEAAEISSAALYHYMGTKEDLLVRIMADALQAWYEVADEACRQVSGPPEKLCAFVRSHVICTGLFTLESAVIDTEVRSLSEEPRRQIVALRDRYEALLRATMAAGIAAGVFHVRDMRLASLGILEMCNGVSRWYRADGRASVEEIADSFADVALGAVHATRDGVALRVTDLNAPPSAQYVRMVSESPVLRRFSDLSASLDFEKEKAFGE